MVIEGRLVTQESYGTLQPNADVFVECRWRAFVPRVHRIYGRRRLATRTFIMYI